MTATTHVTKHSPQWIMRQMLFKDESLSASLGNYIEQLEEIVNLTSQQIAALSNLARVHGILEHENPSGKGVMHLSQNIAFVQLQFGLEERTKEFEELLRRARKAESCVRRSSDGERWQSGATLTTEDSCTM